MVGEDLLLRLVGRRADRGSGCGPTDDLGAVRFVPGARRRRMFVEGEWSS